VTARERDGGVGGGGTLRAAASPSPTPPTPLSLSLALALSLARLSNVESCYLSPATLPAAFLSRPPPPSPSTREELPGGDRKIEIVPTDTRGAAFGSPSERIATLKPEVVASVRVAR